jgi:hypothetical protein
VAAAKIVGGLDLSYLTIPFGLRIIGCHIVGAANLFSISIPDLNFQGTRLASLFAERAVVAGNICLNHGFCAECGVNLAHSEIGKTLDCQGAVFVSPALKGIPGSGKSLNAERVKVGGYVFLRGGLRADGEVNFKYAEIGANLECDGATLTNSRLNKDDPRSGRALDAEGLSVAGYVFLRAGFSANGEVNLMRADIGIGFECDSGKFTNPPVPDVAGSGKALNASGIKVAGSVFLNKGFSANGEVILSHAEIAGNFECDGAVLENPPRLDGAGTGVALNIEGIKVARSIFLRNGFSTNGEVNLLSAQAGGDLECTGAKITNPYRNGLHPDPNEIAEALKAGRNLRWHALRAHSANIRGGVYLTGGFTSEGEVGLIGSEIGGYLACVGARLRDGFTAQSTTVDGPFFWKGIADAKQVKVDLTNLRVATLVDDESSWPDPGNLKLDGFIYGRFTGSDTPKSAHLRLVWLGRQGNVSRQPYRQLAQVLRNEGDSKGATEVLVEMEHKWRRQEDKGIRQKAWTAILRLVVGYGYYPARSVVWLLALTVLSAALFWFGYSAGSVAPTEKDALTFFEQTRQPPQLYPQFHASIFALESSIPLVNLGQVGLWQPDPREQWKTVSDQEYPHPFSWILSSAFLRRFRWVQICLGWFFTTMFVAGISGIVRKD